MALSNMLVLPKKRNWAHTEALNTCDAFLPYSKVPLSNNTLVQWNITAWPNITPSPHQPYEVVFSFLLSELLLLPMSRQAATPHGGHLFRCVVSWTLVDKYRMSQMPKEVSNRISWKRIFFVAWRRCIQYEPHRDHMGVICSDVCCCAGLYVDK